MTRHHKDEEAARIIQPTEARTEVEEEVTEGVHRRCIQVIDDDHHHRLHILEGEVGVAVRDRSLLLQVEAVGDDRVGQAEVGVDPEADLPGVDDIIAIIICVIITIAIPIENTITIDYLLIAMRGRITEMMVVVEGNTIEALRQIFPAGEVEIEETWLALLPITAVEVALRTMDI